MNGHARVDDTDDRDVVDETAVRSPRGWTGVGERKESRHRFSFLPFQLHDMGIESPGREMGK